MASHSRPITDADELTRLVGPGGDDPPGFWLGSGAAVLGLAPLVNATDVAAVFEGNAPRGPTLADPARDVRAPGETGARLFRFEPPPDVAALWAIAPAALRQELETAQFKAVRAAVDYLEADAAQVRTARGERLPAGLVAAAFQRVTPRGPGPGFTPKSPCSMSGRSAAAAGRRTASTLGGWDGTCQRLRPCTERSWPTSSARGSASGPNLPGVGIRLGHSGWQGCHPPS